MSTSSIKATGAVSMVDLDKQTRVKHQDASENDTFPEILPSSDPVDGSSMLHEVANTIRQHVIADPATIDVAALWVVFTWLIDVVDVAPIANITASENRL